MKRFLAPSLRRVGALALLALSGLVGALPAYATGTASGTPITNTATLNYSVGGVGQTAIGSSPTGNSAGTGTATSFVVDTMINVKVETLDTTAQLSVPGQTGVTTTFRVTNTGNAKQDFYLTQGNVTAAGQTLFGLTQADNIDVSGNCTIDAGSGATAITNLNQDVSVTVKLYCNIPANAVHNNVALVYLKAAAKQAGTITAGNTTGTTPPETGTNSPSTADVVWADLAGSDDGVRDAAHSARSAYLVSTASLTVKKTVAALCDPYIGTTNATQVPGSFVQYSVTISNASTAGASATLTQISDALSTNVTFDKDLIQPTGASDCIVPATGSGKGVKIVQANRGAGYPKLLTTTSSDTDGASLNPGVAGVSSNVLVIDFAQALPDGENGHKAGELQAGESVTVIYQVQIN